MFKKIFNSTRKFMKSCWTKLKSFIYSVGGIFSKNLRAKKRVLEKEIEICDACNAKIDAFNIKIRELEDALNFEEAVKLCEETENFFIEQRDLIIKEKETIINEEEIDNEELKDSMFKDVLDIVNKFIDVMSKIKQQEETNRSFLDDYSLETESDAKEKPKTSIKNVSEEVLKRVKKVLKVRKDNLDEFLKE